MDFTFYDRDFETMRRAEVEPGQCFISNKAYGRWYDSDQDGGDFPTVFMAISDTDDEMGHGDGPPPYLSVNLATGNIARANNRGGENLVRLVNPTGGSVDFTLANSG